MGLDYLIDLARARLTTRRPEHIFGDMLHPNFAASHESAASSASTSAPVRGFAPGDGTVQVIAEHEYQRAKRRNEMRMYFVVSSASPLELARYRVLQNPNINE